MPERATVAERCVTQLVERAFPHGLDVRVRRASQQPRPQRRSAGPLQRRRHHRCR